MAVRDLTYNDVRELLKLLAAARSALRSYQYGNDAKELAKDIADRIDAELAAWPTVSTVQMGS
jgi:hypothetical protein